MSSNDSETFKRSHAWKCFCNYLSTMEHELPTTIARLKRVRDIYDSSKGDCKYSDNFDSRQYVERKLELKRAERWLEKAEALLEDAKTAREDQPGMHATIQSEVYPHEYRHKVGRYEIEPWKSLKDARSSLEEAKRKIQDVERIVTPAELQGWSWYMESLRQ